MFRTHDESKRSFIAENLRATFFSRIDQSALILSRLNHDTLDLIGTLLSDKEKSFIKLAQTSKAAYQTFYIPIKKILINVLKELVKQDDTIRVNALLHSHPFLLLRKEPLDLDGIAYQSILTTPYQDALGDPMAEEMRDLLEECFPGKTREEQLAHAALQAEEFKSPCFNPIRQKADEILKLTVFAYETYASRYQAWRMHDRAAAYFQPFCDAWLRVDLIQRQWPKRLRKLVSVINLHATNFENLPRDLPEPHLFGECDHLWRPDRIGRDLGLFSIPAEQELGSEPIRALLGTMKLKSLPALIRHGEGETAVFYLYGPCISLNRDESIWQLFPIDPLKNVEVLEIDFTDSYLSYLPRYEKLYQFGASQGMHVGSGGSQTYAIYNDLMTDENGGEKHIAKPVTLDIENRFNLFYLQDLASNSIGIMSLYKKRIGHLQKHLTELQTYLPSKVTGLKRKHEEEVQSIC